MSCQVKVSQGILQGKVSFSESGKKYYSFEGIPYALPPVGKLRFKNPQEPIPWQGVRDATKPGNKCAQFNPYNMSKPMEGSEDCLYLNIYTPCLPEEKIKNLPVLFFVHGGRFLLGQGDYYKPDYFLKHDVILVTCNYRLHVLGFLCLNIPEAPGNVALKDTVMALRWVNRNIVFFNGDCRNITAFGESAGGAAVLSYLTSKMAFGLCKRIISQSGSMLSDLFLIDEDPIEKGVHLASLLGKELTDPKSIYDFLITVPIDELVSGFAMCELGRPPYIINAYFLPVVEKVFEGIEPFFEEYPLTTIRKNNHQKLPVLTGFSSHEGALFLNKNDKGDLIYEQDLQHFLPRYHFLKYDSPETKKMAKKLHNYYFKGKTIDDSMKLTYIDFYSDVFFNRDISILVELLSKHCELYLYTFSYYGNMNTRVMKKLGIKGATHGDLIQYQFYRKAKAEQCSEQDRRIVDFVAEAWCNFARNGKPTGPTKDLKWPTYTPQTRQCLNIDEEINIISHPFWDRTKFWMDLGERAKL